MEKTLSQERVLGLINLCLQETFEKVGGIYLDPGTSLFETLATINAEEASQPVSAHCASLAAQVKHVIFYIHTTERYMPCPKAAITSPSNATWPRPLWMD